MTQNIPSLPPVGNQQIQQRSHNMPDTIQTVNTTHVNHVVTLYDEIQNADNTDKKTNFANHMTDITTILANMTPFNLLDGVPPTQGTTTDPSQSFPHCSGGNPLSTNKAHPNATAIVTHLQCLFYPPPMLHNSIPIFAQPNIAMPPTDSPHQHHLLEHHNQHHTTQTCGHKAFTHALHTMTTTAALDGLQNSKIPADANKKDPKLQKHTAYKTHRPHHRALRTFVHIAPTTYTEWPTFNPMQQTMYQGPGTKHTPYYHPPYWKSSLHLKPQ